MIRRFRYFSLAKGQRGVLFAYMRRLTGYSRQHLSRLLGQYRDTRSLKLRQRASRTSFACKYQPEDVALLAELDTLHDTLSGPATRIEVNFDGGEVSSDGGVLLVRKLERRLGLLERVASVLNDARDPERITHRLADMLRQRVFGLVQGYEDLNDHAALRNDVLMQAACERDSSLASGPDVVPLGEPRGGLGDPRGDARAVHRLVQGRPRGTGAGFRLERRFFHAYYDNYCYLRLYVFCGEQLLVAYLRPNKIDDAKHAGAVLKLLVRRLRQAWPSVRIIMRADSGFFPRKILSWCERNNVGYCLGLAKNSRLNDMTKSRREHLAREFKTCGVKQRELTELRYGAHTWNTERCVIARLKHSEKGDNPRYIVTNLEGSPSQLYEDPYCARGEMENRIKEAQLGRRSHELHEFNSNQFQLLLASLAYILIERLRALALSGTEFGRLQVGTLRAKLLKVGAVIVRNTRRLRVMLTSAFPYQSTFIAAARALDSP